MNRLLDFLAGRPPPRRRRHRPSMRHAPRELSPTRPLTPVAEAPPRVSASTVRPNLARLSSDSAPDAFAPAPEAVFFERVRRTTTALFSRTTIITTTWAYPSTSAGVGTSTLIGGAARGSGAGQTLAPPRPSMLARESSVPTRPISLRAAIRALPEGGLALPLGYRGDVVLWSASSGARAEARDEVEGAADFVETYEEVKRAELARAMGRNDRPATRVIGRELAQLSGQARVLRTMTSRMSARSSDLPEAYFQVRFPRSDGSSLTASMGLVSVRGERLHIDDILGNPHSAAHAEGAPGLSGTAGLVLCRRLSERMGLGGALQLYPKVEAIEWYEARGFELVTEVTRTPHGERCRDFMVLEAGTPLLVASD